MSTKLSSASPRKVFWPLLSIGIMLAAEVAAICSLSFLLLPSYIGNLVRPPFLSFVGSLSPFLEMAPFSGLLAGLPCWWLLIEIPRRASERRGMAVGILSSIIAHPVMWISFALLSPIFGEAWAEFDLFPQNVDRAILFSLLGLVYVGWISIAVGCLAGPLLVRLRQVYSRE